MVLRMVVLFGGDVRYSIEEVGWRRPMASVLGADVYSPELDEMQLSSSTSTSRRLAEGRAALALGSGQRSQSDSPAQSTSELKGNGVADLPGYLGLRTHPQVVIGEALDPSCLEVSDRTMLSRVEIATLLRLEELRPDGHRWPVPDQPSHHIA